MQKQSNAALLHHLDRTFLGAQYLSRVVNLQNRVLTSHAHRFYPPANQNASKYENSDI
jgi:hypothetical protein